MLLLLLLWSSCQALTPDDNGAKETTIVKHGALSPITPQLHKRLLKLQQLSAIPTVNQLLQLQVLLESGHSDEPRVIKRIRELLVKYEQQVYSMCNQFLVTRLDETTPASLVETVLFLATDDSDLYGKYMTPRERRRLKKAVERYHQLPWPLSKDALVDAVAQLSVARTLREMVTRLHAPELDMASQLIPVCLKKLHSIAKKVRIGVLDSAGKEEARLELVQEIEGALAELQQLGMMDRGHLRLILGLWDFVNEREQ
jgi:hypothetical protein